MDIDAFTAAHGAQWDRLAALSRRGRRLTGAEADDLVALYQQTATHLSLVRSTAPDPVLLARLSTVVAQGRAAITGTSTPAWAEIGHFFARRYPAVLYRAAAWWVPVAVLCTLVSGLLAAWVTANPEVQATIAAPDEIRELTRPGGKFETYYSTGPAASFAAHVWTNNAWVAAGCLLLGVLGLPVLFILWQNAANLGVSAGLMAAADRLDVFFGLILPHGLLELTCVFVAAGTGLKLGWTVIDPGPRSRADALAEQGRSVVVAVLGLACTLAVCGAIEGFVTPSGLPTWARVGIGVTAEVAFLLYVFVLGRRAARTGETGDLDARYRETGDLVSG
ncbi:stage II sporulation protein M [Pseudonocardiaceae bacterium YIM PH 21723]|nr:stage II sporulation protein M [Pseudonocardiaceae bacterium YIM PH 21723]